MKGIGKKKIDEKDSYVKYGDFGRDSAIKATKELLKLKDPPTAIFAASDEMAVGVVQVCLESGVNVPKDLSVIGFDDNPLALRFSHIPITTMRQPLQEMSVIATETLHKIITGKLKGNKKIILQPELIQRSSCRSLT